MAIVKALLAASPYLLRYSFDYDGLNAPETITVTNAQLLADLGLGTPLRDFLDVSGLTSPQCHTRYNSPSFAIYQRTENVPGTPGSFPGYAINIDVDGDGRPQLVVIFPIKDTEILGIIDLVYRHTYDR